MISWPPGQPYLDDINEDVCFMDEIPMTDCQHERPKGIKTGPYICIQCGQEVYAKDE